MIPLYLSNIVYYVEYAHNGHIFRVPCKNRIAQTFYWPSQTWLRQSIATFGNTFKLYFCTHFCIKFKQYSISKSDLIFIISHDLMSFLHSIVSCCALFFDCISFSHLGSVEYCFCFSIHILSSYYAYNILYNVCIYLISLYTWDCVLFSELYHTTSFTVI